MKYIGIDYGRSRVGVAASDSEGKIAFPKMVLKISTLDDLVENLCRFAREERAAAIIVGLPPVAAAMDMSLRGEILGLAATLKTRCVLPVELENEMFTTKIARKSTKTKIDSAAAALILQSFLDRKNRL